MASARAVAQFGRDGILKSSLFQSRLAGIIRMHHTSAAIDVGHFGLKVRVVTTIGYQARIVTASSFRIGRRASGRR